MSFKDKHTFLERKQEADKVKKRYPDRVPVICEVDKRINTVKLQKIKYLVPDTLTVGQFFYVIRKELTLKPEEALFILVNNTIPLTSSSMSQIYKEHKEIDNFLYFSISKENFFG